MHSFVGSAAGNYVFSSNIYDKCWCSEIECTVTKFIQKMLSLNFILSLACDAGTCSNWVSNNHIMIVHSEHLKFNRPLHKFHTKSSARYEIAERWDIEDFSREDDPDLCQYA